MRSSTRMYTRTRRCPCDLTIWSQAAWAGQEGSFLLWIVMNSLVGLAVILFAKEYESPVMAIICLCQVFLISMIVGLQIGPLPIGSSPFATLAEKFPTAPMILAGIIPSDGQGLNDLLRNYWMVIHPPVSVFRICLDDRAIRVCHYSALETTLY